MLGSGSNCPGVVSGFHQFRIDVTFFHVISAQAK
jgi:hypothetical protein